MFQSVATIETHVILSIDCGHDKERGA